MKRIKTLAFVIVGIFVVISCTQPKDPTDYLKTVLNNLEEIKSAEYHAISEAWNPGDTAAVYRTTFIVREYDNPADTTIGAGFVKIKLDNTPHLYNAYDGKARVSVYEEHKGIMVDSFKVNRNLPFRLVEAPFYNYTRNILKYALDTSDSVSLQIEEEKGQVYVCLTIFEDRQVEFFGKAYKIPDPPFMGEDPTSVYKIWIDKKTNLPYKYRREMSHSISVQTVDNPVFNKDKIENLKIVNYFPEGYEIRYHNENSRKNIPEIESWIGKSAPAWTLISTDGSKVSLQDIKGKVVLLQFTSVGCGPCRMSVPFLNELAREYGNSDFDMYAIELSSKNISGVQTYKKGVEANYSFLHGNENVRKLYDITSFPIFVIMDKNHIIRKRIIGYQLSVNQEIKEIINELLQKVE